MIKRFHWPKLIATTAVACVTLSTYAIAGGPRSGAARDSFRQSGMSPSSRFDMRNNSGSPDNQSNANQSNSGSDRERSRDQSTDTDRNRDADSGADAADTSESGQSTAAHSETNDSEHRNSDSSVIHRANNERAVEAQEAKSKDGESERAQRSAERSEVSKKFDSSMLLADIAGANAAGPTNNPGLSHMSQQGAQNSESGRTTAQNAIDQHGSANPSTPPGHHYGWKRGENNPQDTLERERLSPEERERMRKFLREHLDPQQRQRLEGILQNGLAPSEREELRDFFKERLTPKQWEVLKAFLNHKIQESD